MKEGEDGDQ